MIWFGLLVICLIVYLNVKGGGGGGGARSGQPSATRTSEAAARTSSAAPPAPVRPSSSAPSSVNGFRPRAAGTRPSGISFGAESSPTATNRLGEQVTDFVTGASIVTSPTTYQCGNCHAFYAPESFALLRSENGGQCASCRSVDLRVLGVGAQPYTQPAPKGPRVATLEDFRSFEGRVVTFSGRVVKVLESRRGGDFAIMFEDKTWKLGFKLVFFKGALDALGGDAYARALRGKVISVRGLIVNHRQFGYQIIVNNSAMVLSVGP